MKKFVAASIILMSIATSCDKKVEQPTKDSNVISPETTTQPVETTAKTPAEEGLELIKGADCLSCHKDTEKLVGPSYQDIAAKYTEADTEMLAEKIINGGQGNWGDVVMRPHSGMSKETAKKMIQYIFSLKK